LSLQWQKEREGKGKGGKGREGEKEEIPLAGNKSLVKASSLYMQKHNLQSC